MRESSLSFASGLGVGVLVALQYARENDPVRDPCKATRAEHEAALEIARRIRAIAAQERKEETNMHANKSGAAVGGVAAVSPLGSPASAAPSTTAPRVHEWMNDEIAGTICRWCGVKHIDTDAGAWGRITDEQKAKPIVSDACAKAPPDPRPTSRGDEDDDDAEDPVSAELERVGLGNGVRIGTPEADPPMTAREVELAARLAAAEERYRRAIGLLSDIAAGARRVVKFLDEHE